MLDFTASKTPKSTIYESSRALSMQLYNPSRALLAVENIALHLVRSF